MIHAAPKDKRCNQQPGDLREPCLRPKGHNEPCMDERARLQHEIERLVRRAVGLQRQLGLGYPELRALLQRAFREATAPKRQTVQLHLRVRRDP